MGNQCVPKVVYYLYDMSQPMPDAMLCCFLMTIRPSSEIITLIAHHSLLRWRWIGGGIVVGDVTTQVTTIMGIKLISGVNF